MANNSTISLKIKVEGSGEVKKVTVDTNDFKNAVREATAAADKMHREIVDWAQASAALGSIKDAVQSLQGVVSDLSGYYEVQIINEQKLATSMRNTMGATDEQIKSIRKLCSAQQELGVIGDEVQLAGAQEMATYLGETDSLKKLIPVMNDMIAQQYGLGASAESAASIATMMGKVMQGQTSALSRYGYSFTEAQEAVLKFGTESERASVLAQVISESVGGMNESLAKTDAGKQQQMANVLGDIKEQIGGMLEPLKGCIALFAETGYSVTYIIQLYSAIRSATSALGLMITKEKLHNALMAVTNTVTKTVKVSMMALNAVLNGNPIGLVVGVIAALVTSLKLAYEKSDKFRQVCDVLYSSIKNVGKWIYDKLTPAFNTLCDAVKSVWNYLAPLFGLNPSMESIKNEVAQTGEAFDESSDSVRKYLEMMKNVGDGSKTKVEVKPVAGSIDALQKVVNDLNQKLNAASEVDRATIVADLVFAEDALKKAQEKLDQQKFEARYTLKPVEMVSNSDFLTGIKNPLPSLKEGLDKIKLPSLPTKDIYTMNDALADSTSMFRSLGQAAGGAFGSVMNYLSGVLQTLPNLIAQLRTVFVAQTSTAAVSAASGQAQQGPWGWLGVGAAIAATLAAVASIPKFANGAIAYGPTLGLFGEYAGASNNPEVVAPLDKLQSMISTDGGFGKVEFVIDGRVLKGILKKVEHLDYRSR